MKYAVSLLLGAFIGGLVALLFAPSSGQELRSNIKTQADLQSTKARDEWNKSVRELRERVNKPNSERKQHTNQPILPVEAETIA